MSIKPFPRDGDSVYQKSSVDYEADESAIEAAASKLLSSPDKKSSSQSTNEEERNSDTGSADASHSKKIQ